jgi:hypothetical protein
MPWPLPTPESVVEALTNFLVTRRKQAAQVIKTRPLADLSTKNGKDTEAILPLVAGALGALAGLLGPSPTSAFA